MPSPLFSGLIAKLFARPQSRRDRRRTARPGMERLEDRTVPNGSFSGRLYHDANANWVQDAGEAGVAGAVVEAFDNTGAVAASGTTDANGNYVVSGVPDDSCNGRYTLPVGTPYEFWYVGSGATSTNYPTGVGGVIDLPVYKPLPLVSVEQVEDAVEGGDLGWFKFTRTGDVSEPLTVGYDIDNMMSGAAEPVADYDALPGSVTFSAGSATADVAVNALYEYVHEEEEYVRVSIAGGIGYVPAIGFATVAVQDKNSPPVFSEKIYKFYVNGLPSGEIDVGTVLATDPDKDDVQYFITEGQGTNFHVEANKGTVTMTSPNDVPMTTSKLQFQIEAHDRINNPATATVIVTFRPIVMVTGDFTAVEGNTDTITLTVVRIGRDLSQPLTVTYEPQYSAPNSKLAAAESVDLASNAAVFQPRIITIPAGSGESAPLVVVATQDGITEPIEYFKFVLTPPTDASYQVYAHPSDSKFHGYHLEGLLEGQVGYGTADLRILGGVGLFGRFRSGGSDEHVVDPNDIRQGWSQCWFAAALLAAARARPDAIRDMMTLNPDGTVTVRLYNGAEPNYVTVPMQLTAGSDTITLSGDTVDEDGSIVEIWPQILEAAYAQTVGWQNLLYNGSPVHVWQAMFGQGWEERPIAHIDYDAADNENWLTSSLASGKMIALATFSSVPGSTERFWTIDGKRLFVNHAYVVTGIVNGKVRLQNPWGDQSSSPSTDHIIEVPIADLKTYFGSGYTGNLPL